MSRPSRASAVHEWHDTAYKSTCGRKPQHVARVTIIRGEITCKSCLQLSTMRTMKVKRLWRQRLTSACAVLGMALNMLVWL
jgi:hypothetical protein